MLQTDMDNIPRHIISNSLQHKNRTYLTLLGPNLVEQKFTYLELLTRSAAWMNVYLRRGLTKKSQIVLILPHSLDLYAAYTGALMAGMIPAMFSFPSAKQSRQEYLKTFSTLIENAGPELIVTYTEMKSLILHSQSGLKNQPLVCDPMDVIQSEAGKAMCGIADPNPEDTAFIQYSSGTTGVRKGIAVSHRALLWQIQNYAQSIQLNDKDSIVSWLPLYHDMGLICCYFLPLLTHTPVIAMSPFDWVRNPSMLLLAIHKYRGTLCWLPNFAYNFLAKNVSADFLKQVDLSCIRGMVNCSEPLMAQSHRLFLERFACCGLREDALASSYALAENTFAATSGGFSRPLQYEFIDSDIFASQARAIPVSPVHPHAKLMVSSGQPLAETCIEIISPDGQILPERCVGQIRISGPSLFSEYHKNPQATKESLISNCFYTGDLGYLANHHLFVTARTKDVIIIAGKNIYPQDIEQIVNEIPGIIPGRCIAMGVPDTNKGTENLVILAETKESRPEQKSALQTAIYQSIAEKSDCVPSDIRLLEPMWLLKTTSGKVARLANREKYLALLKDKPQSKPESIPADLSTKPQSTDILSAVMNCVRDILAPKNIHFDHLHPDQKLISSGLIDSLSLISLILKIENCFSVKLGNNDLGIIYFDTPQKIAELVQKVKKSGPDVFQAPVAKEQSYRETKSHHFLNRKDGIDMLFIGSSKSQELWPVIAERFGYKAYNFYVKNCMAEDWYCILKFVMEHNKRVLKHLLIGIDIESFSDALPLDLRLISTTYLINFLEKDLPLPQLNMEQIQNQFDQKERVNELLLRYKVGNLEPPFPVMDPYYGHCIAKDASMNRSALKISDPLSAGPSYFLRLKDFTRLLPQRVEYFRRVIRLCEQHGIRITCFPIPMHPQMDAYLSEKLPYTQQFDALQSLCRTIQYPGFLFLDTRFIQSFEGSEEDFGDGAHIGPVNSDKLLQFVLTQHQQHIARRQNTQWAAERFNPRPQLSAL